MKKDYALTVDLKIDGEKKTILLAEFGIEALQKYTSYCEDAKELLKLMPSREGFSVYYFINSHLEKDVEEHDPFSIKTSNSPRAKKIKILYKNDIDVLLVSKNELYERMVDYFYVPFEKCLEEGYDEDKKKILIDLYNRFSGNEFFKEMEKIRLNNLDIDGNYDYRYEELFRKKWMFIATKRRCIEALIEDAAKDERKLMELAYIIKEKTGELLPNITELQKEKRINDINYNLKKQFSTARYINQSIISNLCPYIHKKEEKPIKIDYSPVTDQDIVNYNQAKAKENNDSDAMKIIELLDELLSLKLRLEELEKEQKDLKTKINSRLLYGVSELKMQESLVINEIENIKHKIKIKEYVIEELENDRAVFSDAGFIVETDKEK